MAPLPFVVISVSWDRLCFAVWTGVELPMRLLTGGIMGLCHPTCASLALFKFSLKLIYNINLIDTQIHLRNKNYHTSTVPLDGPHLQLWALLTHKHKHGAHPLHGADGIGEEDHRSQDGEELASRGDDGASQGTEIHNCHEDEALEVRGGVRLTAEAHSVRSMMPASWLGRPRCPLSGTHLAQGTGQAKEQDVVDDGWVPFGEAQELPELPSEQDP